MLWLQVSVLVQVLKFHNAFLYNVIVHSFVLRDTRFKSLSILTEFFQSLQANARVLKYRYVPIVLIQCSIVHNLYSSYILIKQFFSIQNQFFYFNIPILAYHIFNIITIIPENFNLEFYHYVLFVLSFPNSRKSWQWTSYFNSLLFLTQQKNDHSCNCERLTHLL